MEYICSGNTCPRRLVCRKADVKPYQCLILDFKCSDENGWDHFERNDNTVQNLQEYKNVVLAQHARVINEIDQAIAFIE